MILRGSYGVRGALFLDYCEGNRGNYVVRLTVLRGIAGISYFDWEDLAGFLTLGGDFKLLGLSLPGLITFLIFGLLTLASVLAVVKY